MFKRTLISVLTISVAVVGTNLAYMGTALAFGGCVDSPENPTWLLAGIGGAAAGLPWLRAKLKRHRKNRDK